jgi:hypothetical protein
LRSQHVQQLLCSLFKRLRKHHPDFRCLRRPAIKATLKLRTLNATRGWIDLAFKVQRRFRNNASKATLDLKFAPSLAFR